MIKLNNLNLMFKLINCQNLFKIHNRCTHIFSYNKAIPNHFSFNNPKLYFSKLVNKKDLTSEININLPIIDEIETNSINKVNSESPIDVDEELQRYTYEEFEECEETEEVKISTPRVFLKRGCEGVFDSDEIEELLKKEKMDDVVIIDIARDRNFCSEMLIATARSRRQLHAVAEKIRVMYKLKRSQNDRECIKVEGSSDDWIAMDLDNLIVHLMMPDVRKKYKLEMLWGDGEDEEDGVPEGTDTEEFSFDEELKKVKLLRGEMDRQGEMGG